MRAFSNQLEAHARFTPDAVAVFDVDHRIRHTYASLWALSRAWTARLRREGVGFGDRVAVLAHNHVATFAVLYACAELGAVLFPMNWRLSPAELQWQWEHSGSTVLLCDPDFAAVLDVPVIPLHDDPFDGPGESGEGAALSDPWLLMYTSGTSGRPKGALLTHRQVYFNAVNTVLACGLGPECRTLTFTPLFHTGGMNCLSTPMFHVGGQVVLTKGVEPGRDLALIDAEQITHLIGVPTIYQMMADHPDFESASLSSVQDALCGGAPLSVDLLRRYLQREIPLRQGFGLTEVGPNCFSMPHADQPRKLGSVGKAIHHVAMRLVRPDGTDAGVDEPGELWLKGPTVFGGYLNAADATIAAFSDGWFRTGDILRCDAEGFYFVCGRSKEMFISGGENVYPAEVEAAIYRIPGVALAVVIGVPDERWGEVGHAFVQPVSGVLLTEDGLRTALADQIASYKVPKYWTLDDELPLVGVGKVDKQALMQRTGANR